MKHNDWEALLGCELGTLLGEQPALRDLFEALQLPCPAELRLGQVPAALSDRNLRDKGLDAAQLMRDIRALLEEDEAREAQTTDDSAERQRILDRLERITVCGGWDKSRTEREQDFVLRRGETLCVSGATGSGKTRLLEDIACLAAGDTPSGRSILLNGHPLSERVRMLLENQLCATLAQSMNFVMELSCREFVELHAQCKGQKNAEEILEQVLACANQLAGEAFGAEAAITQLSGGQSRALMIADLVCLSDAPVVLIDEPENAGIDKHAVVDLLSSSGKIVLISTHEPVLALSCRKRLVMKNGIVGKALVRSPGEEALLVELRATDDRIRRLREALREGAQL